MGEQLLREIAEATGLPKEAISQELTRLVKAAGLNPAETTLEDLRLILAEYVQDVLLEAKDRMGINGESMLPSSIETSATD